MVNSLFWGDRIFARGGNFSAFASAKFALRGLAQSLTHEYQLAGVHVCHVILDGIIDTFWSSTLHAHDPDKMMKPQDIAETYWQIAIILNQHGRMSLIDVLDLKVF